MSSFVTVRFVGTTGSVFTNNQVYDVLGWAADGSNEPLAVVLGGNGEPYSVDVNMSNDWNLETVDVLRPFRLFP